MATVYFNLEISQIELLVFFKFVVSMLNICCSNFDWITPKVSTVTGNLLASIAKPFFGLSGLFHRDATSHCYIDGRKVPHKMMANLGYFVLHFVGTMVFWRRIPLMDSSNCEDQNVHCFLRSGQPILHNRCRDYNNYHDTILCHNSVSSWGFAILEAIVKLMAIVFLMCLASKLLLWCYDKAKNKSRALRVALVTLHILVLVISGPVAYLWGEIWTFPLGNVEYLVTSLDFTIGTILLASAFFAMLSIPWFYFVIDEGKFLERGIKCIIGSCMWWRSG